MSNSKFLHSFFLFFFFISFASSSSSSPSFNNTHHKCSAQQSLALLLFKQNLFSTNHSYDENNDLDSKCQEWLGSHYHPIMMNWNGSVDCCTWDGVTCNHLTGDVIGLDLSCGMLQGTIHPNTTLFHLPHLQRLNLAYNDFHPSYLLHEIGRFANSLTHLNVSNCWFTGQIPLEISLLSKLVSLDLSRNEFDFSFEPNVFNNLLRNSTLLRELSLTGNNISLVLPTYLNISSSLKLLDLSSTGLQRKLPDNILNLQYLETLDLSNNQHLTGPLPKVNKSISNSLKWLDLGETNLSGDIPDSIGHLKSLITLRLSFCSLTGSLPKSIVHLRNLTTLDLSTNSLNGTLPSRLFTLPSLENIYLDNNMFSGSLPLELFNCRSLKELSLGYNQFVGEIDVFDQGPIPQTFRQLIDLTLIDLSFNNFTGVWELDKLISSLKNLKILGLSYSGLSVVTNNANPYVNPNFRKLSLASCKLTVFPESLQAMRKLEYLDLSSNEIHGHIPDWAGEIGGNQLFYLNLSHNFITGLPQFQWDELQYLCLESNLIQGPFPPSICNASHLWFLDMSNNNFDGVIPQCFANMINTSLEIVNLGNNHFHGTIPNTYEDCGYLEELVLNGNQLEGEVPSVLSKCWELELLDLGNNHLNDTFPGFLRDLRNLQVLVLKSNNLYGPIETSSTIELPFPSLRVIDLSHNGFVGHLPGIYFQNFNAMKNVVKKGTKPQYMNMQDSYYSTTFAVKGQELLFERFSVDYTIIDLSNNKFEREIPAVISDLTSLIVLNLSHNSLTGRIPHALGNLKEIESLDLSRNQLTGEIPQSLADITALEVLDLSQNHLVGPIPKGTQFSTFNTSFGGNLGLCGLPLPKPCEHPSSLQHPANEDMETGFTWKVVMLGYGCGTPLGLVMGYLMLSTKRPKWLNAIVDAGEHMIQRRQNKRIYVYMGK